LERQATDALVSAVTPPDTPYALPTTRDHIGRVVVPVTINGRGPFRFVVDTGANHSTISPGLVRTLGLMPAGEASIKLDGITGTAQVSFVTIDRLQAGDLSLNDAVLPVVWAPVMGGADGILGAAGLAERSLTVDFQRNRVVISRAVEPATRSDATKIHARRLNEGLMILEIRVGELPVTAVIDTGSERTLGNLALRNALKAKRRAGSVAQVTSIYGATEQVELGEIQRAPPISIQSLHITDVAIIYGSFHIFDVWGLKDRPAMIIGMDVLGTVASLGIDFKNEDIYVAAARVSGDSLSQQHGVLGSSAAIR
jgi:predicted aspartyl protease